MMKKYSISAAYSNSSGDMRDIFMLDAASVEDAKSKAITKIFDEHGEEGITDVALVDVREA